MSIATGMCVERGVVLCADRQLTIGDAAKGYEQKILTFDAGRDAWCLSIAHAGGNEIAKLVKGTILAAILERVIQTMKDPTAIQIREAVAGVLRETRKSHPGEVGKLQLLFAFGVEHLGAYWLYKSTGSLVREVERNDPIEVIGWGDSSLTRFLTETLCAKSIDLDSAAGLSLYVVNRAKKYIPYCGGRSDLLIIRDGTIDRKWSNRVRAIERQALDIERGFAKSMRRLGKVMRSAYEK